jgi:SPP1 family predicted phage head-tail adaptor
MLQTRVRTGELDKLILLVRRVIITPATNEDEIIGWEPLITNATIWARKKDYEGREVAMADRVTFIQKTVFTVRYRNDLDTTMRVIYRTRVYAIISITENESDRDRFTNITCELIDTEFYT